MGSFRRRRARGVCSGTGLPRLHQVNAQLPTRPLTADKRNRGSSFSVTSYRTCVDPRHALVLVEGARSPRCTCHFMGRPQEKICWYKKRALSRIYVYKQVSGTEFLYSVSEAAEVALYTSSTVPEGRVMCSTVVLCAWCTRTVRVELHRNVRTHPVFGQHHSGGAHVCVCCSM